ncbi:MAG: ATP-binding protein [Actinomycetota bacterium]|nr:ATP-binding protein [Actinomycetota bacterium]
MELPAIPSSARTARRFVGDALASFGVGGGDLAETAVLLTSELVTNAVLYTGGTIEVAVQRADGAVVVSVGDSSTVSPQPRRPGPEDPSGRGLGLVEALSEAWGVEQPSSEGKAVWFLLRDR